MPQPPSHLCALVSALRLETPLRLCRERATQAVPRGVAPSGAVGEVHLHSAVGRGAAPPPGALPAARVPVMVV